MKTHGPPCAKMLLCGWSTSAKARPPDTCGWSTSKTSWHPGARKPCPLAYHQLTCRTAHSQAWIKSDSEICWRSLKDIAHRTFFASFSPSTIESFIPRRITLSVTKHVAKITVNTQDLPYFYLPLVSYWVFQTEGYNKPLPFLR